LRVVSGNDQTVKTKLLSGGGASLLRTTLPFVPAQQGIDTENRPRLTEIGFASARKSASPQGFEWTPSKQRTP
jgi:hypothetical protein